MSEPAVAEKNRRPYPYVGLDIIDVGGRELVGSRRRWIKRWIVHSKSDKGRWYLVEYLDGRLTCSCPHGQIVHSAWWELEQDGLDRRAKPLTDERRAELNKRLGERCSHLTAVDHYRQQIPAGPPPRPDAPVNVAALID